MSSLTPEFLAWANQSDLRRVVAIEATIYRRSDGQPLTLYFSDAAPPRGTWDNINNFEVCVLSRPEVKYNAQEMTAGASLAGFGSMELGQDVNALLGPEGNLRWKDLHRDYRWGGGPVVCKGGGPDLPWIYWAVAQQGWMARPTLEREKLTVPLKSLSAALATRSVARDLYTAADGVPSATVGRSKPVAVGSAKNVTPVLVSEAPYTYQVHAYGPIQAIDQVRVGDAVVSPSSINLTTGKFTLSSQPDGAVTCDVQGWIRGGVYLQTAAQIIDAVLRQWGGAGDEEIDAAGFSTGATAAPQALAVFWSNALSVQNALDGVVLGLPIWWGDDPQGRYSLLEFGPPDGEPVLEVYDDTAKSIAPRYGAAVAWSVKRIPSAKWYSRVTVQGDRNWTPNATSADAWMQEEYRSRDASGDAPTDNLEVSEETIATCMTSLDDCQAAAEREIELHGVERVLVSFQCLYAALALRKGDLVRFYSDMAGMDDGFLGVVIAIELNLPYQATVTLWG